MSKHSEIQKYYGETLKSSQDLKTNACCTPETMPAYIKDALINIHVEVLMKYYGCGLTIPNAIEGLTVLDLGSGSGRDCYLAAQLVGESGHVIGVDMTQEQLAVANKYLNWHADKFKYSKSNVTFYHGNIEKLDEIDIRPGSIDLIISNCVINLATNKQKVLDDAFNLLRPGGELYFSDVYSDRRVPKSLQNDEVLWGECLSGALYWNDFISASKQAGFKDPRLVESRRLSIENSELEEKLGNIKFYSATYRLFKLNNLENACEDYGHKVSYIGGIKGAEDKFMLDAHHLFEKGTWVSVCGNTFEMLNSTRYMKFFEFSGDYTEHKGIFVDCGASTPFDESESSGGSCC
jgi:arsenite methyltransferase